MIDDEDDGSRIKPTGPFGVLFLTAEVAALFPTVRQLTARTGCSTN